jgi:DNA-binding protein H-NS
MDIKAGTAFKHVRDQNAELSKEVTALKAQLKAKESQTGPVADAAEVTELKAKVARYEGELAISRIEATDEFINNISKPLTKAAADVQAMADKYKIPTADLQAAMAVADPIARTDKLSELSANFNRMDLVRFDQLIGKIDQLNEQKQTQISNAAEKWKATQAERDAAAKQAASAFDANWKSALQTAAGKLDSDGFFKPTGKPERDAEIAKVQALVKNLDVAQMSNEDLAASLYKAYAFPLLLEELSAAMATIGEKEARILKLSGTSAAPAGNGQVPTVAATGPKKPDETASFAGTMKTALQGVLPP